MLIIYLGFVEELAKVKEARALAEGIIYLTVLKM